MPVFGFNKAFGIGRGMRVFLNLRDGLTRGAVPADAEGHEEQAGKLKDVIQEQRKTLKSKDQEIKEQAENLENAWRRIKEEKKTRKSKDREIFRLKSELRAARERLEDAPDDRSAPPVAVEPETGALPDFVIIGAGKFGTTSLYDLLTRYPQVEAAALKELRYFNHNFDKGLEWYRSQFPPSRWKDGRRSITGEATPGYLFGPHISKMMAKVVPEARLIVLLRNPVDRAYSHYHHAVRTARETRTFEEAVEVEKEWLLGKEASGGEPRAGAGRARFEYLKRGTYVDQLLGWSEFFDEEQMLVLKSEDFFEREPETLKIVLDFLDLTEWEPETWEIRNEGRYDQEMDPVTRRRLEEFFKPHNKRLYEYLGVDLGW
ncbi:MAG: sulfotransferase domain-containing protein [Rubrobacter sp.]|nr:sulfotransferase domain-containing protein [Rubrobacter sp.]